MYYKVIKNKPKKLFDTNYTPVGMGDAMSVHKLKLNFRITVPGNVRPIGM